TRPAGAAFELGLGRKQRQIAARAGKRAFALLAVERAGEGPLGAMTAQHIEGGWRQDAPPFVFAFNNLEGAVAGAAAARPPQPGQHRDAASANQPGTSRHGL